MKINTEGMHPTYLGWQVDWPVFIKIPFAADGKKWEKMEHFNWAERNIDQKVVATLYAKGFIYHNSALAKANKVGDRLGEMNPDQLYNLVRQLNDIVRKQTTTTKEFNNKKCKISKIADKQRGLIRRFLNQNPWIVEQFYELRDDILGE